MTENCGWCYTRRGLPSETLETITQPVPEAPSDGLVVRVHALSINPVDYKFAIFPDWIRRGVGAPSHGSRHVPCADFAGTIHAIGEQAAANGWEVGEEVFGRKISMAGNGTLQQYAVIESSDPIIRKPPALSWIQAAAIPLTYTTVYGALVNVARLSFDGSSPASSSASASGSALQVGQASVLIIGGTSGTGSQAIQLAKKKMGMRVVTTCSAGSGDMVKRLGADDVIDYKTGDVAGLALASRFAPYSAVLDCIGGKELIPHIDQLLRPGGHFVSLAGDFIDYDNMTLGAAVYAVGAQTLRSLRGSLDSYIPPWLPFRSWLANRPYTFYAEKTTTAMLATAPKFVQAAGDVLVDDVFSFKDAKAAFARIESGRAKGKVVITVVEVNASS